VIAAKAVVSALPLRGAEKRPCAAALRSGVGLDCPNDSRNQGQPRGAHCVVGESAPPPLAVLRIPKVHLEVPVLPGTDDFTLNRAVGHIDDTAMPGAEGNSGIAGHRDGFFRGLKDIAPGDAIELETLRGKELYTVERTWVVSPEDVSVLDATPTRSLTLVTCYPFYHVGPAPHRFIVRAGRVERK